MITFSDNIARKPYLGSTEIAEVWLGNIPIYPESLRPLYDRQYLTMEVLEDGTTFHFNENGLSYSIDKGITWNSLDKDVNTPSLNTGDRIMFKGQLSPHPQKHYGIGNIISNNKTYNVEGNPMSLIFGDNFGGVTDLTGYDYAFYALFTGQNIVNAQNLAMVATTLSPYCYCNMFNVCRSLITTPALPATTLATQCYDSMFYNCTSLVTAPALPATTLATQCYEYMFYGCTSLVNAPQLPATTLVNSCYQNMFKGCTSLNYIKAMFTTTPSTSYTRNWVEGVASSGTFVKNSAATWDVTGINGIPTGWTVVTE